MSTAIVLFRRDLRLADNPALTAACNAHGRVVLLYIHDPQGDWPPGAASRWWLHHALAALQLSLQQRQAALWVRQGGSLQILCDVVRETDASAVYWNRLYEPEAIARDTVLKAALRDQGVAVHSSNSALWCEPWRIATGQGAPYRVFTPYWRKLRADLDAAVPLPVPVALRDAGTGHGHGMPLQSLDLLPRVAWDSGLRQGWMPGESGAQEMLDIFADDALGDYVCGRDLPARHGTSRLSPHLHFGEISPRQIHHRLLARVQALDAKRRPGIEPYLRELGWREFAHHLLYHFPQTPDSNFNPRFDAFRWAATDETALHRWRQGRTGIPLVDAGMRELWHTGWMHNRVRMMVASFLTKNLRQHWHHGARWFWDTLVDANLANNTAGWQWVAGCGADAAPYFRVFNPLTQAKKFDPQGAYLRRWLPELADAPLQVLHEPWKDPGLMRRSGYPTPLVDLAESRRQALFAYQQLRDD